MASLYRCPICDRRPCATPDTCARFKTQTFLRREAATKRKAKAARVDAEEIGVYRGMDSGRQRRGA